jgi:hypothetical protein
MLAMGTAVDSSQSSTMGAPTRKDERSTGYRGSGTTQHRYGAYGYGVLTRSTNRGQTTIYSWQQWRLKWWLARKEVLRRHT